MKNVEFAIIIVLAVPAAAYADCVASTKTYTSCKSGYYKGITTCTRCPRDTKSGLYGTTVDQNIDGITSCYVPSENYFSDETGSGFYAGNCYY